jgi:hypothetical protein
MQEVVPGAGKAYADIPGFLDAKKTIDDRSLNQNVWDTLARSVHQMPHDHILRVLDIGAGTGTMVRRFVERKIFSSFRRRNVEIMCIDPDYNTVDKGFADLHGWLSDNGITAATGGRKLTYVAEGLNLKLSMEVTDLEAFASRQEQKPAWDIVCATALFDLVDIPQAAKAIFSLARPGSFYYFPLIFDGLTEFQPELDPDLDRTIITAYHRAMDERLPGAVTGSRAGRLLFQALKDSGQDTMAVGSSDWVVFPGRKGYSYDEITFLSFILDTIENTLSTRPEIGTGELEDWLQTRRSQMESGDLVYIAHQLDFLGQVVSSGKGQEETS